MKVLLIERYPTLGDRISALLERERPNLRFCGQAYTAETGLQMAKGLAPDIIILEPLLFSHQPAIMLLKLDALRTACPKAKLLGVSSSDNTEHIRAGLRAGLMDYLYKPLRQDELLTALDRCCGTPVSELEPDNHDRYQNILKAVVQQVQQGDSEEAARILREACGAQRKEDTYAERCILYLEIATAVIHIPDNMDSVPDELMVLYRDFIKNSSRYSSLELLDQSMDSFLQQSAGLFNRYIIDQGYHQIQAVLRFVDEHLGDNLSLKRLSGEFYISTTYFSRLFRAKTGMKFSDYLAQRRIERAKLLLTTTNASVTEIAKQVGYNEPNSFTRLFKAHTGITPVQYRNQKGEGGTIPKISGSAQKLP